MYEAGDLHNALKTVCPLIGVSIEDPNDRTTWRFDPAPEATPEQVEAAREMMLSGDLFAVIRGTVNVSGGGGGNVIA